MPPAPLLQTASPLAVGGTFVSFALFLSLTAHLAARNVLGDVRPVRALLVGPLPAAIAVVVGALGLPAALGIALAVAADVALIRVAYRRDWRLTGYVAFIHAVVSVILGTVLVAGSLLLASAPV